METTDQAIDRVARLAVVDRARLLRAGVTDHEISSARPLGVPANAASGVYATFGHRLGYEGKVLAAALAAGPDAVASHRSALVLWDLLDGEHPVEITAPRDGHPLRRSR